MSGKPTSVNVYWDRSPVVDKRENITIRKEITQNVILELNIMTSNFFTIIPFID
jgi:hypothetical protein